MSHEEGSGLGYVRYADDMLFAIRKGSREGLYEDFWSVFEKAFRDLELKFTSSELNRERKKGDTNRSFLVLGLSISIHGSGRLEIRGPLKRWKKKL